LGSNRRRGGVTPDMSRLVQISDSARLDSIRSLSALSQRLAPIPRSVTTPLPSVTTNTSINHTPYDPRRASFFCKGAQLLQENRNLRDEDISTPCSQNLRCCSYCNGYLWIGCGYFYLGSSGNWEATSRFLNKSHAPWTADLKASPRFGCIFCDSIEEFGLPELCVHLPTIHSESDFRNDRDMRQPSRGT